MLKKLFAGVLVSLAALSTDAFAVTYEIQDIGTFQTHSSVVIGSNNNGQILGWYNIDANTGKHFSTELYGSVSTFGIFPPAIAQMRRS